MVHRAHKRKMHSCTVRRHKKRPTQRKLASLYDNGLPYKNQSIGLSPAGRYFYSIGTHLKYGF